MGQKKLVRKAEPPTKRKIAWPRWTGFKGKTAWDWLDLLVVPLVLAVLGLSFAIVQQQLANKQEAIRQQAIEEQRAHNATTQAYLDVMKQLLLDEDLGSSESSRRVDALARAQTLTTLKSLDAEHNEIVFAFLKQSGLLPLGAPGQPEEGLVPLYGSDLSAISLANTDLKWLNLRFTDLHRANLQNADMYFTNLTFANLSHANLEGAYLGESDLMFAALNEANLKDANFSGANLNYADLSGANLKSAKGLTQDQIDQAGAGDSSTLLPDSLDAPSWWSEPNRDSRLGASLAPLKSVKPAFGDEMGIPQDVGRSSDERGTYGALVYDVQPGEFADAAGFQPGDIIVSVWSGGHHGPSPVRGLEDMQDKLDRAGTDTEVLFIVRRWFFQEGWQEGLLKGKIGN